MKVLVYIDLLDGKPTAIARELANGAKQLAGSDGTVELADTDHGMQQAHGVLRQ